MARTPKMGEWGGRSSTLLSTLNSGRSGTASQQQGIQIANKQMPATGTRSGRPESREPRAESREPRAESREPRAESRDKASCNGRAGHQIPGIRADWACSPAAVPNQDGLAPSAVPVQLGFDEVDLGTERAGQLVGLFRGECDGQAAVAGAGRQNARRWAGRGMVCGTNWGTTGTRKYPTDTPCDSKVPGRSPSAHGRRPS